MGHLMNDDVFERVRVLLGEFDVEPDVASLPVTGSPLGLHASDAPARDCHAELWLPVRDQLGDGPPKLIAIPPVEEPTFSLCSCAFGDVQEQAVTVDLEVGTAGPF